MYLYSKFMMPLAATALFLFLSTLTLAQQYTSTYTKLNFDQHCKVLEEYELGVSAKCSGYQQYPVYFSEGDLRQMVRFGHANPKTDWWESFGEFNSVGTTIEWRLYAGAPVATILRWHIEIADEQTGEYTKSSNGQVLVISTVASYENPTNACVAGYVDAKANANANVLARQIADTIAPGFRCGRDAPKFHGNKGKSSGSPTNFSG